MRVSVKPISYYVSLGDITAAVGIIDPSHADARSAEQFHSEAEGSEKSISLPLVERSAVRLLDATVDHGYAIPVGRDAVLIVRVDDQGFAKRTPGRLLLEWRLGR